MRYTSLLGVLAVVGLAMPVHAEVLIETPRVTVHVGRPLPLARIIQVDPPPVALPPVETITIVPGARLGVRPPTLEEFAASFQPAPGRYEVVLLNPETCCPVKVCFCLPCGCPKVRVHEKSLVFHYALLDNIAIRFHHDGSVTVKD